MTPAALTGVRRTVCNITRELGIVLEQLEHAEELTRLPSADPAGDASARHEAYVTATEAALTAQVQAESLADLCAALAAQKTQKAA